MFTMGQMTRNEMGKDSVYAAQRPTLCLPLVGKEKSVDRRSYPISWEECRCVRSWATASRTCTTSMRRPTRGLPSATPVEALWVFVCVSGLCGVCCCWSSILSGSYLLICANSILFLCKERDLTKKMVFLHQHIPAYRDLCLTWQSLELILAYWYSYSYILTVYLDFQNICYGWQRYNICMSWSTTKPFSSAVFSSNELWHEWIFILSRNKISDWPLDTNVLYIYSRYIYI